VTSPGAPALRAALDLVSVADDVEMVFFGSAAPQRLFGPYRVGDASDRGAAWWSPVTEGETLTVEFFAPNKHVAGDPRIVEVGPSLPEPADRSAAKAHLRHRRRRRDATWTVACSPLNGSTAFRNAMAAVAQMVFNEGGFVLLCTGTLLNDTDASTQRPWFFGANHCFDNDSAPFKTRAQMQPSRTRSRPCGSSRRRAADRAPPTRVSSSSRAARPTSTATSSPTRFSCGSTAIRPPAPSSRVGMRMR
jgi:hypothetical protein